MQFSLAKIAMSYKETLKTNFLSYKDRKLESPRQVANTSHQKISRKIPLKFSINFRKNVGPLLPLSSLCFSLIIPFFHIPIPAFLCGLIIRPPFNDVWQI